MLSQITESSTWRQWYQNHNLIVDFLNGSVVAANTTVYGAFVIGSNTDTSLLVANNLLVNSTAVRLTGNTTLAANVTVTSAAGSVNLAPNNQVIIQPSNGTIFNSGITINAVTLMLGALSVNAALAVNSTASVTGNLTVNGTATLAGVGVRQLLFTSSNSVSANALASPQYDDFNPTGLAECQMLNLTPSINAVVTGLAAPNIASGSRVLYIQNLSDTYKITFPSGNTSSGANNRFKTTNGQPFDLLPGAACAVVWAFTNKQWRFLTGSSSSGEVSSGNTVVSGTLTVTGDTSLAANVYVARLTANVSINTVALTATGATSLAGLNVTGNSTFAANATYSALANFNGVATFAANASFAANTFVSRLTANVSISTPALTVTGATTVANVAGNEFSGSKFTASANVVTVGLNVSGASSLQNVTAANVTVARLTATSNVNTVTLAASGDATVGGTLGVTGAATFNSTIGVTGAASVGGKLTVGRIVLPVGTNLYAT